MSTKAGEVQLAKSIPKSECDVALGAIKAGTVAMGDMTFKELIGKLYNLSDIKDYNSASLCMYSGPRERGNGYVRRSFSRRVNGLPENEAGRLQPVDMTRSVGWLGTGDSHFQDDTAVKDFSDHFFVELPRVSTIVVPHHGSKYNYAKNGVGPLLALVDCFSLGVRLFIAPAKRSVYGHPHEEVESALRKHDVLQIVSDSAHTQIDELISTVWP